MIIEAKWYVGHYIFLSTSVCMLEIFHNKAKPVSKRPYCSALLCKQWVFPKPPSCELLYRLINLLPFKLDETEVLVLGLRWDYFFSRCCLYLQDVMLLVIHFEEWSGRVQDCNLLSLFWLFKFCDLNGSIDWQWLCTDLNRKKNHLYSDDVNIDTYII